MVNPWFWFKNGHFSNFCFQAIDTRKMSFKIFKNKKIPFQAIKTRSSKSRKIDIFLKGLTHGVGPKMGIFPTFLFREYRPGKCLLRDSRTKKMPFQAIKTGNSKSRKIDIFLMVLDQKWLFFELFFFQAIQTRKMSFTILQNEKCLSRL